ncbi:Peroxidasin -like protein [Trichinella murrelli]|uniref:Peroxidasin-like protein n=1 Tax=Trichinella murrelli TaxID=144512 RepID=A0A0V0UCN0_9BILA|nr:Peroxidasin -like protein [Trichinella murrelli]
MNFFQIALLLFHLLLKTHTAFCQQDKRLFSENILCNTEHGSCQKISAEKSCSKLSGQEKTVFCENRKKRLHMAIKQAQQYVHEHFNISRSSFSNGEKQNTLWAVYTASHITAKQLSYPALVTVYAAKHLKSAGMTINEIENEFLRFELDQAGLDKICPSKPIEECAPGGFRTYSGFCNNVKKPLWGSAFQAFDRMYRASYNDEPRKSLNNFTLPACNEISRILFNSYEKKKSKLSLMVAQWANMIYNDMARIGSNKNEHLGELDCCGADKNNTECLPIENFYISGKKTCIPYARTMPAPAESCSLGSRKQSNQVNSFLDASPIYGINWMKKARLDLKENGFSSDYNINFNPNTLNEYAAAAGFFFYGLLPEKIVTKHSETKATPMRDAFYNPSLLYEQNGILNLINHVNDIDLVIMGFLEKPAEGAVVGPTFACILARQCKEEIDSGMKTIFTLLHSPVNNFLKYEKLHWLEFFVTTNSVLKCSSKIIEKMDLTPWTDCNHFYHLPMTKEKIKTAIHIAEGRIRQIRSREEKNNQSDKKNDLHDFLPFPHGHHMKPNQIAIDQAKIADVLLEATRILIIQDEFNVRKPTIPELDIDYLQNILPNIDVRDFIGFDEPRKFGVNGDPLPSARHVANVIHKSKDIIHKKYSHILMTFGQFLDHDLTHTPMSLALDGSLLNCQRCDSHETVSVNCWPIKIPENDPYFPSTFDDGSPRCMHFARSLIGQLKLGYREQMNQLTSYIDASNVYGSNDCIASDLRLFNQGKLNISKHLPGIQNTLPFGFKDPDCRMHSSDCFIAGDIRVNENSGLMVPHILFVREHNRLAEKLFMANNLWSDEKLYQEIRKIIGAVMQHIVFKEWLPKVLGHQLMEKYELYLMKSGYFKGYDKYCDATISNEFASAAFRFGHTLIRDTFLFMDPKHNTLMEQIRLKDMFFNITPLNDFNRGGIQSMISGLIRTPAMAFDRFINQDLRNHLFEFKHEPFSGMDLPAINIQRARDHGIPGYNFYREVCGLKKAKNFQDLLDVIDQETIDDLKNLYKHVDDIDLFPGLISEKPLSGALVGPTLGCLIGEQMQRLRKCDRFWYENDISETKFTPGQLSEIRKMTMAKIICNNSKNIKKIQPNVFDLPDNHMNKEVDCSALPDIDITKWLDRDYCFVGNKIIQMGRTKHITPCVSCTCTHYGANCHALRVESCKSLFDQFSMAEIVADTSCVIQCSGMINSTSFH